MGRSYSGLKALRACSTHAPEMAPGAPLFKTQTNPDPCGGLAALDMAQDFVPALRARMQVCRDRLPAGLPRVTVASPPGGMYWLRWCFAAHDPTRLDEGLLRLRRAIEL